MGTTSEKTALPAIIHHQHLRIRIDAVPANVASRLGEKKIPAMCGFQKSEFRSDAIRRR